MFLDLGEIEKDNLETRLIQLKAMKKIKELFGTCKEIELNYCDDNGEYISDVEVLQYIIFHNLKHNGLQLQLCVGDIPLLIGELTKQKKITESRAEYILTSPIIISLKYMKNKERKMKKKVKKLLKKLYYYDPYIPADDSEDEDAISFKPFSIKVKEKYTGVISHDIYFPCTVSISDSLVDIILELFL